MKWAVVTAATAGWAAAITGAYRRQWQQCLCGHLRLVHLHGLRWHECVRCGCSAYIRRRS